MKLFPRFVSFKGDNGQLLTISPSNGTPYLTFTSLEPTRLAAHEVICFDKEDRNTVVIRAANGRFWCRNEDNWIVATRDETPSQADKQCIFKIVKTETGVALQSKLDGCYLRWYSCTHHNHGCSAISTCVSDTYTRLEISDASHVAVVLPCLVTVKEDSNGMYLGAHHQQEINWLTFGSSKGGPDLPAVHEIIQLPNGNVMIKNVSTSKYWRCSSVNWVWADADQSSATTNTGCHFEPVKITSTKVAFRAVSTDRYLKRYSEYWKDALCGIGCNLNDTSTHFTVGTGVVSQTLSDISYQLKLAEVTEIKSLTVGKGTAKNATDKSCDIQVKVKFTTTVSRVHKWSDSSTFNTGGPLTSLTVGLPEVCSAQGSITVGGIQCFKTYMCTAVKETVSFQAEYTVKNIEPNEEVTVSVECTQGKCKVPFTYSATPIRIDGVKLSTIQCIDGVYEGVSVFNTRAAVASTSKKTSTYLPVCCTYSYVSRGGVRKAAL